MNSFEEEANRIKEKLNADIFFLCDKLPGACNGWRKGWLSCMNDLCRHTSDPHHARYKNNIKTFNVIERGDNKFAYFETDPENDSVAVIDYKFPFPKAVEISEQVERTKGGDPE